MIYFMYDLSYKAATGHDLCPSCKWLAKLLLLGQLECEWRASDNKEISSREWDIRLRFIQLQQHTPTYTHTISHGVCRSIPHKEHDVNKYSNVLVVDVDAGSLRQTERKN